MNNETLWLIIFVGLTAAALFGQFIVMLVAYFTVRKTINNVQGEIGEIRSTVMPMLNAIGSSLVSVTAFGLTTATNYAFSGLVDWELAIVFLAGGAIGGLLGARLAKQLADRRGALNNVFVGLIFVVATYMLYRSWIALGQHA